MNDQNKTLENARIMMEEYFIKINWNAKILFDPYTNKPFITAIITRKLANQFLGERKYQHPDGAWQYFKRKYFPDWLKEKFPIKMKIVTFSFRAIFPDYHPSINESWEPDVSHK